MRIRGNTIVLGIAAACLPATAIGSVAVVSPQGFGGVRIGMTLKDARSGGLVGGLTKGCELASPLPWVARLRPPLRGFVTFDGNKRTSKLVNITVMGEGNTAKGIGIGSTFTQVRKAYPTARVENAAPQDPIQLFSVWVGRPGKGMVIRLQRKGGPVDAIYVPLPEICE